MSKHLVLLVHADPVVNPRYRAALAPLDPFELANVNLGAYSTPYGIAGNALRDRDGRVLPSLVAKYARNTTRDWATISVVSFSAGYALARALLSDPRDREAIAAYVALDSIHAGFNAAGRPNATQLEPFVRYASEAKQGRCLFWLGHTDVRTPRPGAPNAFASTTEVAQEIARLAGGPGGNFFVRAYNEEKDDLAEHRGALNKWGPDFVAEALVPYIGGGWRGEPAPDTEPAWRDARLSLGQRCLLWSEAEMAAGVREEPLGSNRGHRVDEYLDPPDPIYRRATGERLRLKGQAWCAAAATMAHRACTLPGEAAPAGRVSGIEMIDDAKEAGTWMPTADVKAGTATVEPGDLCILQRGQPGSWERHVCRVREWGPDGFTTIGGNEGAGEWRVTARRLGDVGLLGFVMVGRRP